MQHGKLVLERCPVALADSLLKICPLSKHQHSPGGYTTRSPHLYFPSLTPTLQLMSLQCQHSINQPVVGHFMDCHLQLYRHLLRQLADKPLRYISMDS